MKPEEAVHIARLRHAKGATTLVTLRDAALYAGLPYETLRTWARAGKIARYGAPPEGDGRARRVDLGQVIAYRDMSSTLRPPGSPITYRALAVMRGVASGKTFVQIGEELGVRTQVVEYAAHSAVRRIGARSRGHAIALLVLWGVIGSADIDDPTDPEEPGPGTRNGAAA